MNAGLDRVIDELRACRIELAEDNDRAARKVAARAAGAVRRCGSYAEAVSFARAQVRHYGGTWRVFHLGLDNFRVMSDNAPASWQCIYRATAHRPTPSDKEPF